MAVFDITSPDQGAKKQTKVRVKSFAYGDGYSQESPEGINNVVETWNLSFTGRSQATIMAVEDFLISNKGYPFTWVNPLGRTFRYKCKEWDANYEVSTSCSLTCTFDQSFEP